MWTFYVAKLLELVGITSLGAGLLIGIGNDTRLAAPLGPMSPEGAMRVELLFLLVGLVVFGAGRWLERRA